MSAACETPDTPESPPPGAEIEFPEGLPGLEEHHRFVLLQPNGLEPLVVLASLVDHRVSLAAIPVDAVWPGYRLTVGARDWEALGVRDNDSAQRDPRKLLRLAAVILPSGDAPAACNLYAPILIHPGTMRGRQTPQAGSQYPMVYSLRPRGEDAASEESADAGAA